MMLCLDVGNTHIHGGVFIQANLKFQFRYATQTHITSDQLGVFFAMIIRENGHNPKDIKNVTIASVVPSIDYSLRASFIKYFDIEPFMLQPGVKTGLKIKTKNPTEVGADRIANSIAACELFPRKNIAIIDFGTATTIDVITAEKEYIGGVIMPGMRIAMETLSTSTAKLVAVNIVKPECVIGNDTISNIQSGLYYSHLGAIQTILAKIRQKLANDKELVIIGTGGFANLFEAENIFNMIIPELVLQGLRLALLKNSC